jgi:hypothetical protein
MSPLGSWVLLRNRPQRRAPLSTQRTRMYARFVPPTLLSSHPHTW